MEESEVRAAVVVEDDGDIRDLLISVLTQAGFDVHAASTGTAGVELVREHCPIVTTLDVSLPDIDGFEVARRVRGFSGTYIVMLTAHDEEIDTLMGLDAGADDYITKPFRPRELRARIQAMLRRPRQLAGVASSLAAASAASASAGAVGAAPRRDPVGAPDSAASPAPAGAGAASAFDAAAAADDWDGVLTHNGLRLDIDARLVDVDGTPVHLTRTEFDLLAALLAAPRRVLPKVELVRDVWPEEYGSGAFVRDADKRAVEVHVANLRRKLGDDAAHPRFIETVRGTGYRLTPKR
ncbi:response regulator transcription factor [Georgenia yuyongxinii]|uniref:Response regulator transcription factor n=1 Tax=Georgenia yuyongxinii TaxID=2589797 RepID=A0A5B8C2I2_9MICO|nr:response regulator transcription factor [Georgenia yuyongxinii]QDC23721.1 response regulator transcription factor [Georgenia yuyongxinii]